MSPHQGAPLRGVRPAVLVGFISQPGEAEMSEIDRMVDQLQRAYDGDPWYGGSLRDALDGLTPEMASRRVSPAVHSIWEIVLHITSWMTEVARRLVDGVAREPADGDWPPVAEPTENGWLQTLDRLGLAQRSLIAAVRLVPDEHLDLIMGDARDRPLGSGVSRYVLIHGVVQHTLAHTAQITLLRKALASA
jgi:hypothetical protein